MIRKSIGQFDGKIEHPGKYYTPKINTLPGGIYHPGKYFIPKINTFPGGQSPGKSIKILSWVTY